MLNIISFFHCLSLKIITIENNFTSFRRTFMMDWIFHSMKMFSMPLEYFLWNFPLMAGNLLLAAMMNQYMSTTFTQTNWHCVYLLIQYGKLLTFLAYISHQFLLCHLLDIVGGKKKNANFYMDILLCTPQRGVICVMLQLQKPHLFALQLCIVTMCFYTSFFVCWFTEWCCHSFFIFSVWCQHGSICWWKWPSHIFWKWWHIMQGWVLRTHLNYLN